MVISPEVVVSHIRMEGADANAFVQALLKSSEGGQELAKTSSGSRCDARAWLARLSFHRSTRFAQVSGSRQIPS